MDELEKDWISYEGMMEGIAVRYDSLIDDGELTDRKSEQLNREKTAYSISVDAVVQVVKALMMLGARCPSGLTKDNLFDTSERR